MTITQSISVGGKQYSIDVQQEGDAKTVTESAIATSVSDITPELLDQIERGLLKEGVKVKLPSGATISSEQELDALKNLQSLTADDAIVDCFDFMKVFQQCQMLMRKTAREQRASELSAQVTALNSAADKMKAAADKRLTAGIAQGVMGIVGGIAQIGAGAAQLSNATGALQNRTSAAESQKWESVARLEAKDLNRSGNLAQGAAANKIADGYKQMAAGRNAIADNLGSRAQAWGTVGQGVGGIANSGGTILGGVLNHAAEMQEVDKAKLEAEAKVHETNVQHANEIMQNTLEIIRDIQEKLAATQQAQTETNRGIARNI